jgi:hypothetical protein
MLYERLEALVGAFSLEDDAERRLIEGARMTVLSVSERHAWLVSRELHDTGDGAPVPSGKVLYAHRGGRAARLVAPSMQAAYLDETSIHRASDFAPVCFLEAGRAYVVGSAKGGVVMAVTWPETVNLSADAFEGLGLPPALSSAALYYAAFLIEQGRAMQREVPELLELPAPPAQPPLAPVVASETILQHPSPVEITGLPALPPFALPELELPEPPVGIFSRWETYYKHEDSEIMGAALGRSRAEIEAYTSELQGRVQGFSAIIQGEAARFQAEAEAYRAEIERSLQQARLTQERLLVSTQLAETSRQAHAQRLLQAEISSYEQAIMRYKEDVMRYQAQVQAALAARGQEIERAAQVRAKHLEQAQANLQLFTQTMEPYQ